MIGRRRARARIRWQPLPIREFATEISVAHERMIDREQGKMRELCYRIEKHGPKGHPSWPLFIR